MLYTCSCLYYKNKNKRIEFRYQSSSLISHDDILEIGAVLLKHRQILLDILLRDSDSSFNSDLPNRIDYSLLFKNICDF